MILESKAPPSAFDTQTILDHIPRPMKIMNAIFRWRTSGAGKDITIQDMATSHIFNTMRMMYNHIADELLLFPVTSEDTTRYPEFMESMKRRGLNLKGVIKTMLFFQWHIETRKDLPFKYRDTFEFMKQQLQEKVPETVDNFFNWTDTLENLED
jgi:hypothetical protein